MIRYGWSLAALCRISCWLWWCNRSRKRKKNSQYGGRFLFQTRNCYRPILAAYRSCYPEEIWYADCWYRHWPTEESDVIQSEPGSKITLQRPPSWKSTLHHNSTDDGAICIKFDTPMRHETSKAVKGFRGNTEVKFHYGRRLFFKPEVVIQGGPKNGASVFHCKYFENFTTELRESWWTSAVLYVERSNYLVV